MHVRVVYMYKYRYMYTSVHACTCVCTFLYVHVYTGAILKKGSENLLPVLAVYTYVLHSAVIKQKLNFIDPLLLSMQTFLKLSIYDFGHCNNDKTCSKPRIYGASTPLPCRHILFNKPTILTYQ